MERSCVVFLLSVSCAVLPVLPTAVAAHGASWRSADGARGVEATYDDGTPMAHTAVRIYSPADLEHPFQAGATDSHGRFAFFPDAPGRWRFILEAEEGHRLSFDMPVKDPAAPLRGEASRLPLWQKIVAGCGVLWGLAGFWFYRAARRR